MPAPEPPPKFSWDFDMPDDPFWQAVGWKAARLFHSNFDADRISKMKLDPELSAHDKSQWLLRTYEDELAACEAAAAPQRLADTDYKRWTGLKLGVSSSLAAVGRKEESSAVIKEMAHTPDPSGKPHISALHAMAFDTLDRGDYAEAEQLAAELLPLEESLETLGPHSPQALNVLRLLIRARVKQGKDALAKESFTRLCRLTEENKETKFAKYNVDELEQNAEMAKQLGIESWEA